MKNYELELIKIKHILSKTKDHWNINKKGYQTIKSRIEYEYSKGVIFGLQIAVNQINQSLEN